MNIYFCPTTTLRESKKSSKKGKKSFFGFFGKKFFISRKKQIFIAEKGVLLSIKSNCAKRALFVNQTKYPFWKKDLIFSKKGHILALSIKKNKELLKNL